MQDITIVTLKSFEVNDLILHVDDDQSCQRALVLSDEDNDHVSITCVCVCVCVYIIHQGRIQGGSWGSKDPPFRNHIRKAKMRL